MRIHYPKLRRMTHFLSLSVFTAFKGTYFHILSGITASGVVRNGGCKMIPHTSFILQIIFCFWSFEIMVNIQRI